MRQVIVVKIGTNGLLTEQGKIDKKLIVSIAGQVWELKNIYNKDIIIVSSGAVGLGREKGKKIIGKNLSKIEEKQVLASIGQPILMNEYERAFEYYELSVAQVLLTRSDFASRKNYISIKKVLQTLLDSNIIPIINENDVLSPEELDFSDNDQLAAYTAGMIGAEKVVILSDIDGLYTSHPSVPGAFKLDLIKEITDDIRNMADTKKSSGGTGGMQSKLITARLLMNLGINMQIAKAKKPNILLELEKNSKEGTSFISKTEKKISGIRSWLSTGAVTKGKIYVSTIIADLLKNKTRCSILASGICSTKGDFDKGDVCEVISEEDNISLGYGIIKYSSIEINDLLPKDDEFKKNIIIIHADYYLGI